MNRPKSIATFANGDLVQADIADMLPFSDLSDARTHELLRLAKTHRMAPKDTFFSEGDFAENFFLLVDGFLRIVRTTKDGDQVVMLHITPGQMFGIAKAYENQNYTMTARAASYGTALSWPTGLWENFIQEDPAFKSATRKAVGIRMSEMQDRVITMATRKVEQRIAHAILRLMKQAGKDTDKGVEIDFPLTRQDISEMTGTTLHSVSRCLSKWQKDGIVQSERRRVVVCQPEALPA